MTVELITRFVKILIGFVLVWGGLWIFNSVGCNRLESEMTPTLPAQKNVMTDPRVHQAEQLNHDDFIAYDYEIPGGKGAKRVTARVVGLPGDRVKMVKGEVFVNGERAATSVATDRKAADDYAEIFVPRNTVFVLCDNRGGNTKSVDSRSLGPIGCWAIVGKLR
ncbi:MAG TPA: signal peptidase I [Planctomycetota bacterium]|nr:signal peptidase I [Planctomycetota bacterium]